MQLKTKKVKKSPKRATGTTLTIWLEKMNVEIEKGSPIPIPIDQCARRDVSSVMTIKSRGNISANSITMTHSTTYLMYSQRR